MATLYVRDIPDDLYKEAQKIAADQGRSLSAFIMSVLEQAIADEQTRQAQAQVLNRIGRRRRARPATAVDSVDLLRQLRRGDDD